MFLSAEMIDILERLLASHCGKAGSVALKGTVSGGSINRCYCLEYNSKLYFLKLNQTRAFPGMFTAEATALRRIAATGAISVPKVIASGEAGAEQFLLLEWVNKGANTKAIQICLGRQLAAFHRVSNDSFGLDHDNYMGSLVQENGVYSSFADFFIEKRLSVQADIAAKAGVLSASLRSDFDRLFAILPYLIPSEPPAFIHGDLWGGNYICGEQGIPVLIDPAIAFSHREADIAMTKLFGGFDSAFYDAYQESHPLEHDWEKRVNLWNLYPLLIHLNLFGRAYLNDVQKALKLWL